MLRASPDLQIAPVTKVLGVVRDSTTLTIDRGFNDEKYAAASAISVSAIVPAIFTLSVIGARFITEDRRAPLLKLAICCLMYASGKPARPAFSGPPGPSARWQ
jgi:hypothetical protein